MNIKLVTFDATNTILRFKVPPWQYYSVIAKDYGYDVEEKILKDRMKDSFKLLNMKYPNFGKEVISWESWWRKLVLLTFKDLLPNNSKVDEIATKLINEFKTPRCWGVAEGSDDLLKLIRSNVSTIGVLSNFDPRLNTIIKNLHLDKHFDFILTSYDVGFSKPDRRIFEAAIERSRKFVEPSQCLHIGDDMEKDYRGAKNAGWHALIVGTQQKNDSLPANHVFHSIEELGTAVKQNKLIL